MAEKTEKATPKKLRDARKKGQVAKAMDFPSAFTFVVSISSIIFAGSYLFEQLATYMVITFRRVAHPIELSTRANAYLEEALTVIGDCSFPILIVTAGTGVLASFLIVGPMFSTEAFKFDVKRLNPVTNIKNMFKLKTLIELIKSILKITGAVLIIYFVIHRSLGEIIMAAMLPPAGCLQVFQNFLYHVIIGVGVFFLIVAIADLAFQKRNFSKEMMMEKFEVRQEYRDTEGDPHIKSRRRERAREIAYQEGPGAAKRARAIVTNPTHLAIALEYEEETDPAPRIATMGQGPMAEAIIKIALQNNIPIMRNVALAHTLFQKGRVGEYVPEETYEAIAEIIKWLKAIEAQAEVPEVIGKELFEKK